MGNSEAECSATGSGGIVRQGRHMMVGLKTMEYRSNVMRDRPGAVGRRCVEISSRNR